MSAPPIAKKRRLIIINKDRAELAPLGGAPPLPLERSSPPLGGGTPLPLERSCAVGGRLPPPIACTRFNNKTWQEYQDWKNTNQAIYEQIYKRPLKCIYGVPREISHKKIPPQTQILVIEMNNDENRIMGIGEIRNQTASEVYRSKHQSSVAATVLKYNIFSDRNYTRYIYIGNSHYATREELDRNHTQSAQYINEHIANTITMPQTPHHPEETILQYLERLLFKGARHMKRGSGITGVAPPNGAILFGESRTMRAKRRSYAL